MTYSSRNHWPLWLVLILTLIALDQSVKYAVTLSMQIGATIQITPWFNWVHFRNTGAAFSFLGDAGSWSRYGLSAIGIAATALLASWICRGVSNRIETIAYSAIAAGAMGNVIDRFRLGSVVDFLDFHWQQWHWPAFNIADILIFCGAAMLILICARPSPTELSSSKGPLS